jgi:DNA-directed RNA polymerase specialized sigma24 family protein
MTKQSDTTQECFDKLLEWLDDDRDQAGKKYEIIRRRMIKLFTCRGCGEAEDLADETITRVTAKIPEVAPNYQGDPVLYFYGVARKVHREWIRRQNRSIPSPPPPIDVPDDDRVHECLDRCMETVPEKTRQLVLRYYENEKKAKIDDRKILADELGIGLNALRIRAHRIRLLLRKCVKNCMDQVPAN